MTVGMEVGERGREERRMYRFTNSLTWTDVMDYHGHKSLYLMAIYKRRNPMTQNA